MDKSGLIKRLEANEKGRDFVIGDLHGAYSCLERALEGVNFDPTIDRLISVGDLVDRGPENERCLRLIKQPWFHAVRGNHEQMMIEYFNNDPMGQYWFMNGGMWGYQHSVEQTEHSMEVRDLVKLAEKLPLLITVSVRDGGRFHALHAELSSDIPLSDQLLESFDNKSFLDAAFDQTMDGDYILWGRFIFYDLYKTDISEWHREKFLRRAELYRMGKFFGPDLSPIYSGHTIMQRPTRFKGQTNIDTGAYFSLPHKRGNYLESPLPWAGLTITEPATDRFWLATPTDFKEVEVVTLG
jgi:predicted phosphodiesterase